MAPDPPASTDTVFLQFTDHYLPNKQLIMVFIHLSKKSYKSL